jgi:hypothetical protein
MMLDAEDIEAIAGRVAELIGDRIDAPHSRLVDAAHVAGLLGVERDWVYAHANQLGGIRLGGPKGRLRFDLATVTDRADRTSPLPAAARGRRPRALRRRGDSRPTTERPYHLDSVATPTTKVAGRRSNAPRPLHRER